jgi:hypothetical protein
MAGHRLYKNDHWMNEKAASRSLVMLQELKKHHGYAREYLRQAEHEGAAGKVPGPSSNTIRNCRRNSFSRSWLRGSPVGCSWMHDIETPALRPQPPRPVAASAAAPKSYGIDGIFFVRALEALIFSRHP